MVNFGGKMKRNVFIRNILTSAGFILLVSSAFTSLDAGAIKDKFLEANDRKEKSKMSAEEKKVILEKNLNAAFRATLMRNFNYCNSYKVTITGDNYERSEIDDRLIYINFGPIVGYYVYDSRPDVWLQNPALEKFILEKGKTYQSNDSSDCDKTGQPSSGQNQDTP